MSKTNRIKLHNELLEFSDNVYFQPPESLRMNYPCIVYSKAGDFETQANDGYYIGMKEYDLTLIGYSPDSELPEEIRDHFRMCSITQYYVTDSLQHVKLKLYY